MVMTKKQYEELLVKKDKEIEELKKQVDSASVHRIRLPSERQSITHRFKVGDRDHGFGHLIVGKYADGSIGEIFIKMKNDKAMCACGNSDLGRLDMILDSHAFMSGILNQFAISVSLGLQHGVPIEAYIDKFKFVRFPPEGKTGNRAIPFCSSIIDYIFRFIEMKFEKKG